MGEIQKYLPACLNCGTNLKATDQFCPQCGQKTRGAKVPLKDFISDFFQDYFTFDSKFFRSILLLIIRPGRLTKNFNSGMRKSYIAPLRMYLFISFIYFFVLTLSIKRDTAELGLDGNIVKGQKSAILDEFLESGLDTIVISDGLRARVDTIEAGAEVGGIISVENEDLGEGGINDYLQRQTEKANQNPYALINSGLRAASVSLFFLLPLFALVLKAFHFRRNKFYVQHLVHALHLHTFGFALLSIYTLIGFWVESQSFTILPILLIVYFVWSLRVVYGQKLLTAMVKAFSIVLVYCIMVALTLVPAIFLAIMIL